MASVLGVPQRTVYHWIKQDMAAPAVGNTILFIPDTQVKPGVDTRHLDWIGAHIDDTRPDTIVHAGDHWDMPSLSSYDAGKKSFEGRDIADDIDAGNDALARLTKHITYGPRLVMTAGNHDQGRIERAAELQRELSNLLSIDNLNAVELGWEYITFRTPIFISGVAFVHYFENHMTGKPLGGVAATRLNRIGHSFAMGHQQVLDWATRYLVSGHQQCGLIAGACYTHQETYKGAQGNHHWRGVIMMHNTINGAYDPEFLSLDLLCRRYEGISLDDYLERK